MKKGAAEKIDRMRAAPEVRELEKEKDEALCASSSFKIGPIDRQVS